MKYLIALCLFICVTSIQGQGIQISGTLSDEQTNDPLPYAHVGIMGSSVGTVTNSVGQFSLIIPQSYNQGQLSFSYLGYELKSLEISKIQGLDNLNILLKPTSISLPDLVIKVDKKSLIEEAIERIPENHDQGDMLLNGFWRVQVKNSKKHIQLSETAFDLVRLDKKDALRIAKTRMVRDYKAYEPMKNFNAGITPKGLFTSSFLVDQNILSKKTRKNHNYELVDATTYHDRPVLVVAFDKKESSKDNGYKGTILLDSETLAFVKINYSFSPKNDETIELFNSKFLAKITNLGNSVWEGYENEFNFQQVDSKWYLRNAFYDARWIVANNDNTFSEPIHYFGDLVITKVSKENVELPEKDERASRGILVNQSASTTSDFWEGYNYIVPDQDFDKIFEVIKELNKSYVPEED